MTIHSATAKTVGSSGPVAEITVSAPLALLFNHSTPPNKKKFFGGDICKYTLMTHRYYLCTYLRRENRRTKTMSETPNKTEPLTSWIDDELEETTIENQRDQLPSLSKDWLGGQILTIDVDFAKPFQKWIDDEKGTVKRIIPVMHNGMRKNFWLNVRNPIYSKILMLGKTGQTKIKLIKTGAGKNTKYDVVTEERPA